LVLSIISLLTTSAESRKKLNANKAVSKLASVFQNANDGVVSRALLIVANLAGKNK
jgi:hypothetical protein